MAPKSFEVCENLEVNERKQYIPIFIPDLYYLVNKFHIPRTYVSFKNNERQRYVSILNTINSYYEELICIYDYYPELSDNINFHSQRFKCLKSYLLFLEDKMFRIKKYGISCKRRKLVFDKI